MSLYHIVFLYLNGLENTEEYQYIIANNLLTNGLISYDLPSDAIMTTPGSGDTASYKEAEEDAPGSGDTVSYNEEAEDPREYIEPIEAIKHYKNNMEEFLDYINKTLNVDLYLISYACRGVWGESKDCSKVNSELQKAQERLTCKKEGLSNFRAHYIRHARKLSPYEIGAQNIQLKKINVALVNVALVNVALVNVAPENTVTLENVTIKNKIESKYN